MESASALAGCISLLVISLTYLWIWRPYKLHTFYRRQQLRGPEFRPVIGNWMDIWNLQNKLARKKQHHVQPADLAVRSLPHLLHWSKLYGSMFTYMDGINLNLCVLDIDIIRELLVSKFDCYRRNPSGWRNPAGWLWLNTNGRLGWLPEQREKCTGPNLMKHINSDRFVTLKKSLRRESTDYDYNKAQEFLQRLIGRARTLVKQWEELINEAGYFENGSAKLDASHDIAKISTNIVLTNLMGSSLSSKDLEAVDSNLNTERQELESSDVPFCCEKFRSFRSSKAGWLDNLLTKATLSRIQDLQMRGREDPKDLLDLMISSSSGSGVKRVKQIVNDCKMMIAAQKSTTCLITNTLLLLARHTDWQVQARAEVQAIRPIRAPSEDSADGWSLVYPKLTKLKVLNMILNESLRLAPPVISIEKLCQKRNRLGKYTVLPGTVVRMPIVLLHHDHELWGEDSSSFRPDRFEHDANKRRPFALLPFSAGPSVCLGFNFALLEAKIILASILDNFAFSLSPDDGSSLPLLIIRKLQLDDVAQAARERLFRSQSSIL